MRGTKVIEAIACRRCIVEDEHTENLMKMDTFDILFITIQMFVFI